MLCSVAVVGSTLPTMSALSRRKPGLERSGTTLTALAWKEVARHSRRCHADRLSGLRLSAGLTTTYPTSLPGFVCFAEPLLLPLAQSTPIIYLPELIGKCLSYASKSQSQNLIPVKVCSLNSHNCGPDSLPPSPDGMLQHRMDIPLFSLSSHLLLLSRFIKFPVYAIHGPPCGLIFGP